MEAVDEEAFNYAMQLVTLPALSMSLKAAIELKLLEIISHSGEKAELFPEEIAEKLPTDNPEATAMVDRILRLLATYAIVSCSTVKENDNSVKRRYGLSPVSRYLVKDKNNASIGQMAELNLHRVIFEGWSSLKETVLGGGVAFDNAHGINLFEYLGKDIRLSKLFNDAIAHPSTIAVKKTLESYKGLRDIRVLVDVGGGVGATLKIIVSQNPWLKGINFDLPHVVADAPSFPGIEHVGGDMFESVPSGDAIFMKWILHNWGDDYCIKLLRNCWKALPTKGKVIVMEGILPETPEHTSEGRGLVNMDLIMLMATTGGKERTEKDFETLALKSGFSSSRKVFSAFGFSIIEFEK